jgi:hypothetical protein
MARIFLSLERMSTVKIRAGSLFCTPASRIGAGGAGFGPEIPAKRGGADNSTRQSTGWKRFLSSFTALHRLYTGGWRFRLAGKSAPGAKSENTIYRRIKKKIDVDDDANQGLSPLRRHRMEDSSRPRERAQRPPSDALRLPVAGSKPNVVDGGEHPSTLRAL